jgi:hypothetical protein
MKVSERNHLVSSHSQIKDKLKELTMKKESKTKLMKKEYAFLEGKENSMAKYLLNYEKVIKLLTEHVGYMGQSLNENTKNQLLWLLKEKNKLEKKLILIRFEKNLLESKIKKIYKGTIENDLMGITIQSCNRDLALYEIEEDSIIQCGDQYELDEDQTEFKFYAMSKQEKLSLT